MYEQSIAPVPKKLLEGYNCAVIAYGQTGTGKTHTIMGGENGLLSTNTTNEKDVESKSQGMIMKTAHGIFQEIQEAPATTEFTVTCSFVEVYLEKVLDLLNPGGETQQLTIIQEHGGDEAAGGSSSSGTVRIAGAAELCCIDESDVFKLLARGNACRTMSSTEMNTDSSRSHAIFIMRVEQHDTMTGIITTSHLHMIDLAGSEMANPNAAPTQRGDTSAVQMEANMINKSLTAFQNCIRAQLENQPVHKLSKQSKLTKFLQPSFGGNCMTWVILTASPSSYNIGETISTIKFGQRVMKIQNQAVVNTDYSREVYKTRYRESEKQRKAQLAVLKAVAQECKSSRNESSEDSPLWDTIDELLASGDDVEAVDFQTLLSSSSRRKSGDNDSGDELEKAQQQIEQLREQLESISKAKEDSDNQLAELQSEVAVLRSRNEHLISNKNKDLEELINAKNELQIMSQRKIEVEHNFRTSQFRENEAIVFLRMFRRFYRNVLRDRAAQGSGSISAITAEISEKVPGSLNLDELVDADKLLLEAGLIEEHEMRDEKQKTQVYVPSKTALIRSATAAKKAASEMGNLENTGRRASFKRVDSTQSAPDRIIPSRSSFRRRGSAIRRSSFASLDKSVDDPIAEEEESEKKQDVSETIEKSNDEDRPKQPGSGADAGAGVEAARAEGADTGTSEAVQWDQTGRAITKRQQLLGTPSGRFAIMSEKKLESELEDLADQCIKLEQALKEEKATVDMLSGRAGGVNKKKLAQEAIQLRQQIEKKTQNLMATAWKMNELNMINKSYNEKMLNREQHVVYLEENYVELQNRNRMIIEQQQEAERKLRDELDSVRKVLAGMSVQLWQYNEENPDDGRPIVSRIRVPINGGNSIAQVDGEPIERRMSDAESEPGDDFQEPSYREIEKVEASTQTDEVQVENAQVQTEEELIEKDEIGIQTDEVPYEDIGTMTDESLGLTLMTATSSDSAVATVQTSTHEDVDHESTPANITAANAVGGAVGAATGAVAIHMAVDHSDESESDDELEDVTRDQLGTGAAAEQELEDVRSAQSEGSQVVELSNDGREVDNNARDLSAIAENSRENETDDSESDTETDFAAKLATSGAFNVAIGASDALDSDESDSESDNEKSEDSSSKGSHSDDIEALTGDIAATGVVPRSVSVDSNKADDDDDDESAESDNVDASPLTAGRTAFAGISGAAVVAAAASVTRESQAEKSKEPESNVKSDNFMSKNIFAATVMSVLNMGGNDATEKSKATAAAAAENEIESYHGNGHLPETGGQSDDYGAASSRDEWAAARDDFDSIFEETAQAVNTSLAKPRPKLEEDPEKSNKEFMDIASRIGHKNEEEIVTMGSKRQLWSHEVHAVDEPRKPWAKDQSGEKRKPWERSSKRENMDNESAGSSFDMSKDNWYGGSDDESEDSYRYETHVLKRPSKKDPAAVKKDKFSASAGKRDSATSAATSEDEFDQMMNATQAALGVAEDRSHDDVATHPENDMTSLTSKEEAMFVGGRTNGYKPRRSVDRPKIRAGVLKQEKKPNRDKLSSSQSMRKKTESRRKLGEDKSKRKKKKKMKSSKSSRDLSRAKSERYPTNSKRDKDHTKSLRRSSEG